MLDNIIQDIIRNASQKREKGDFPSHEGLRRLRELGTELWLDTGDLEKALLVWKKEFTALTTNNTLVNRVVQQGIFDSLIMEAAGRIRKACPEISNEDLVLEVGFVLNCRTALRLVEAFDCMVSVELHPKFSHDIPSTIRYARRYYSICPERFIIKIPLTPAGYLAARTLSMENIPINFTLGFSARQNMLAATLSNPAYVNIFMGRLNQVVIENHLGDGKYVGEKATLATQWALNETKKRYPEIKTRLIGASMRDGQQLVDLAGIDVYTAPPVAVQQFLDLNLPPEGLTSQLNRKFDINFGAMNTEKEFGFYQLWSVDEKFRKAANEIKMENWDSAGEEELISFFENRGIRMFYCFSEEELACIREKGKIPKLSVWKDKEVPLDYLMTVSALEAFACDQQELDERITQKMGTPG